MNFTIPLEFIDLYFLMQKAIYNEITWDEFRSRVNLDIFNNQEKFIVATLSKSDIKNALVFHNIDPTDANIQIFFDSFPDIKEKLILESSDTISKIVDYKIFELLNSNKLLKLQLNGE